MAARTSSIWLLLVVAVVEVIQSSTTQVAVAVVLAVFLMAHSLRLPLGHIQSPSAVEVLGGFSRDTQPTVVVLFLAR